MLAPDQDNRSQLIYVGDPMCSWCFGISEEIKSVKDHFEDRLDFKMVMGGLRPYNTQSMSELKEFLTHHWEDVSNRSGQKFTYGILNDNSITYDTEPPCRATVIVRDMDPSKEFEFFKATQKAFYQQNKNMHLKASYHAALDALKLDTEIFDQAFDSDKYKSKVKDDFMYAQTLGVNSFPTLIIKHNGKNHIIARGYAESPQMIKAIQQIIEDKRQ